MKVTVDGKEIEVFTSEEVEAKAKSAAEDAAKRAVEEFRSSNPDKSQELEAANAKLKEAEELLRKAEEAGGNPGQIERLRKEREDAKNFAKSIEENFNKKFDEFARTQVNDMKDELLSKLSGGDAELRKKIELEFDNYKPGDVSKKGIQERMQKAYQLATDKKPPSVFDFGGAGAGDRGAPPKPGEGKQDFTENQKAIGAVLGVTPSDVEAATKFYKAREIYKVKGTLPPNAK